MATTVEAVERYLETDVIVLGALDRGILNIRQAARWLIETQEWRTTEEAVVSALRRYDPPRGHDSDQVFHLLEESELTARTGLAAITIPRTRERLAKIPDMIQTLEPEDTIAILPETKRIVLIVQENDLEAITARAHRDHGTERNLTRISIHLPQRSETASKAISSILDLLHYRALAPHTVFGTLPNCSFIFPQDHFTLAHKVISELTTRSEILPKPGPN